MSYASVAQMTREPHALKSRYGGNTWVVISGAGDPIGLEYARLLSR